MTVTKDPVSFAPGAELDDLLDLSAMLGHDAGAVEWDRTPNDAVVVTVVHAGVTMQYAGTSLEDAAALASSDLRQLAGIEPGGSG